MSAVDVLSLLTLVENTARRATDDTSLREDLKQDAWVAALERVPSYTGARGASLATYAHRAVYLAVQASRTKARLPVSAPRNHYTELRKVIHAVPLPSSDTPHRAAEDGGHLEDSGSCHSFSIDRAVQETVEREDLEVDAVQLRLAARIRELIARAANPAAVASVLLDGAKLPGVCRTHSITCNALRADIRKTETKMRRDRDLRELCGELYGRVPPLPPRLQPVRHA